MKQKMIASEHNERNGVGSDVGEVVLFEVVQQNPPFTKNENAKSLHEGRGN